MVSRRILRVREPAVAIAVIHTDLRARLGRKIEFEILITRRISADRYARFGVLQFGFRPAHRLTIFFFAHGILRSFSQVVVSRIIEEITDRSLRHERDSAESQSARALHAEVDEEEQFHVLHAADNGNGKRSDLAGLKHGMIEPQRAPISAIDRKLRVRIPRILYRNGERRIIARPVTYRHAYECRFFFRNPRYVVRVVGVFFYGKPVISDRITDRKRRHGGRKFDRRKFHRSHSVERSDRSAVEEEVERRKFRDRRKIYRHRIFARLLVVRKIGNLMKRDFQNHVVGIDAEPVALCARIARSRSARLEFNDHLRIFEVPILNGNVEIIPADVLIVSRRDFSAQRRAGEMEFTRGIPIRSCIRRILELERFER